MDNNLKEPDPSIKLEQQNNDPLLKSQSDSAFISIIKEMVKDLLTTYPELEVSLDNNLSKLIKIDTNGKDDYDEEEEKKQVKEAGDIILEYCKKKFPERFLDILYKNDKIFQDDNIDCTFLPNIDFKLLWNENITDKTKETIWKYLQLIMFACVPDITDGNSFGNAAKLFEALDPNMFKEKLEDTMKEMMGMFSDTDKDINLDDFKESMPNPEKIHSHLSGILDGKIGSLAKEIAEETMEGLSEDFKDASSVKDVMSELMKNPTRLLGMVKKVGDKIDKKLKSGDLNEEELMKEASEMMEKLKTMPGMNNMQDILKKMGLAKGKGKVNTGAFMNKMNKYKNKEAQRERLKKRREAMANNTPKDTTEDFKQKCLEAEKMMEELLSIDTTDLQNVEDFAGTSKRKKKKKKKKNR